MEGLPLDAVRERPLQVLAETFGFDAFRPGQEQVIDALLAGRSALAVFPTGAGKSLCYQLPALLFDGMTVVVSPLIALMKDQIDFLRRSGIDAERLDSSLDAAEQRQIFDRLRAGSLRLLYVAPERFNNERFLAQLARVRISLFAVDEAHCISEWGHNFRPDYLKLAERARELAAERVLALTATATTAVVADIRAGFGIEERDAVVTGFYRPSLMLLTTPVGRDERDAQLVERLRERPAGSTIVYVTLQRTSLRVAALLAGAGLPARAYHAGMSAEEREAVQEWWSRSPDAIVVATIAFGMGIDKANVRYVYHYNLPKSLESYSQEIGRAGRDGAESICELFACADDVPTLENFAFGDTPTREALAGLLAEVLGHPLGTEFAAAELGEQRSRILAALEYLDEEGLVELQPADVRQRYTLLAHPDSEPELVDPLLERFARRESAETARIENVLALVTKDGCQVIALAGYFGEIRTEQCGHCTYCLSGRAQRLPEAVQMPPIEVSVSVDALAALRNRHPDALGSQRQQARFLVGITSPATSRARLTRDPLFGSLAERRFADVLAWCKER